MRHVHLTANKWEITVLLSGIDFFAGLTATHGLDGPTFVKLGFHDLFALFIDALWAQRIILGLFRFLDRKLDGVWVLRHVVHSAIFWMFWENYVLGFQVEVEELILLNHILPNFLSLEDLLRENILVEKELVIWVVEVGPLLGVSLTYDILFVLH